MMDLLEMPSGISTSAQRFSEFQKAYEAFTKTKTFEENIKANIQKSKLPFVFVEGDMRKNICKLFQRADILDHLCDANGCENFNKMWKFKETTKYFDNKILLLYDRDTRIENKDSGNIFKRIVPPQKDALRGIRIFFLKKLLVKSEKKNPNILILPNLAKIRAKEENIPDKHSVNKDEKANLCNCICENGTKKDFENFKIVLEIMSFYKKNLRTSND